MASAATVPAEIDADAPKGGGKKKLLILIAIPLLLAGIGAGLWFGGILPPLLGMGPKESQDAGTPAKPAVAAPVFFELPEIVANLNTGGRRVSFVKLKARLELARQEDVAKVQAALPRVQDMFQTYIREIRPEELRGSIGTYRLREELIPRAQIAAHPAQVRDVLFVEMLVQ
jgi:flagellar FliL protein